MKTRANAYNRRIGLTKKQARFIDRLVSDIRYYNGKKFTRSQVVSAVFKAIKLMEFQVGGVKTERELSKRFIQACKKKT